MEEQYYQQDEPMYVPPPQAQAQQSNIVQSNPEFMQFLFDFKKEVSMPLRRLWRGQELEDTGNWSKSNKDLRLMNESGITWGISYIESYINAVYVVSNYDETAMNWTLRTCGRVVWNTLSLKYNDFKLAKHNIPRVANEIISKIHAILLGARGNGFRNFFTQTTYINKQELYQRQNEHNGWLSKVGLDIFKSKQ